MTIAIPVWLLTIFGVSLVGCVSFIVKEHISDSKKTAVNSALIKTENGDRCKNCICLDRIKSMDKCNTMLKASSNRIDQKVIDLEENQKELKKDVKADIKAIVEEVRLLTSVVQEVSKNVAILLDRANWDGETERRTK